MPGPPRIAVITADGAWPEGLDPDEAAARLELVSSRAELEAALPELSAIVVYDFRTRILHEADWAHAGDIRWIHAASAGVDAVLAPTVLDRDITVTNSRGVFDRAIAEYVLGLMLAVVKDFFRTRRLQDERTWRHRDTHNFEGKRLLVVGTGSIGSTIGTLASAAGMRVEGIARSRRDEPPFERVGSSDDLHDALGRADFVAIAAPLTTETQGMFDSRAFAAMRPGAWLINVGRGPIVDQDALLRALETGQLAGAALDVFEEEPLPPDHPFWGMENVFVSPHMAGDFVGWVEALSAIFLDNLERFNAGEPLRNAIDKASAAGLSVS